MPYGNLNVDTVTTSTTGGILGAGNASIMKNRIINGEFKVSQYNGTSSVTPTSDAYVIDRWKLQVSQASKLSFQQNAGSVTPPVGFINYAGMTSLSAYSVGSSDYFNLLQIIEGFNCSDLGWGTANAKTITVSFQVRSSLTGTFGGALKNYDNSRSYPFSYSIPVANTWTTISFTVAGDTTGTWNTGNTGGILIQFGMGVGSTFSGTAGSWASANYISATGATSVVGTNGATFYITGCQLEVGSSSTGFEYVNYQTSLANCQRYYENSYDAGVAVGNGSTNSMARTVLGIYSTNNYGNFVFKVPKRTAPTVAFYDNSGTVGKLTAYNSGSATSYTADVNATGCFSVNVYLIGTSSYTFAQGNFTASAEL
jgi:hypothetical protein